MYFLPITILFHNVINCSYDLSKTSKEALAKDCKVREIFDFFSAIKIKNEKIKKVFEKYDEFYENKCKTINSIMNYDFYDDFFGVYIKNLGYTESFELMIERKLQYFIRENKEFLSQDDLSDKDYVAIVDQLKINLNKINNILNNRGFDSPVLYGKHICKDNSQTNPPLKDLKRSLIYYCYRNLLDEALVVNVNKGEKRSTTQMFIYCYYNIIKLMEKEIFKYFLNINTNNNPFSANLSTVLNLHNELYSKIENFFEQNQWNLFSSTFDMTSFCKNLDLNDDKKQNSFYLFFLDIHRFSVIYDTIKASICLYNKLQDTPILDKKVYDEYIKIKNSQFYKHIETFNHKNDLKMIFFTRINTHEFLEWFAKNQIRTQGYESFAVYFNNFKQNFFESKEIVKSFNNDLEKVDIKNFDDLKLFFFTFLTEIQKFQVAYGEKFCKFTTERLMINDLRKTFYTCDNDFFSNPKFDINNEATCSDIVKQLERLSVEDAKNYKIYFKECDKDLYEILLPRIVYNFELTLQLIDFNQTWIDFFAANIKLRYNKIQEEENK